MFKKFKDLIGIEEEIDEDDLDEDEIQEAANYIEKNQDLKNSFTMPRSENREAKKNISKPMMMGTMPFKMVIIEPAGFEECPKLADNLKAKKPVIINLEKVEMELARKIFDFLSGATYALNGNVHKIANNIFVFTPENVDVSKKNQGKEEVNTIVKANNWR